MGSCSHLPFLLIFVQKVSVLQEIIWKYHYYYVILLPRYQTKNEPTLFN